MNSMKIINSLALSTLLTLSAMTTVSANFKYLEELASKDDSGLLRGIIDRRNKLAEVEYRDNLDDELESFKRSAIYVTDDNDLSSRGKLVISNGSLRGGEKFKYIQILNIESNRVIGNCYGYDYSCTLMFKFDDKKAKPYRFKATVENDIYSLERGEVNSFMKEVKSANLVKTKINGRLYTFDVSDIDLNKIEF